MNQPALPDGCIDEHLDFLDELRESGETNMFGSGPYLSKRFKDLSRNEVSNIVHYWAQTFPRQGKPS